MVFLGGLSAAWQTFVAVASLTMWAPPTGRDYWVLSVVGIYSVIVRAAPSLHAFRASLRYLCAHCPPPFRVFALVDFRCSLSVLVLEFVSLSSLSTTLGDLRLAARSVPSRSCACDVVGCNSFLTNTCVFLCALRGRARAKRAKIRAEREARLKERQEQVCWLRLLVRTIGVFHE